MFRQAWPDLAWSRVGATRFSNSPPAIFMTTTGGGLNQKTRRQILGYAREYPRADHTQTHTAPYRSRDNIMRRKGCMHTQGSIEEPQESNAAHSATKLVKFHRLSRVGLLGPCG